MSTAGPKQRSRTHSPAIDEPEYVLGTHGQESARLGFQHRLWSAAAHELWERAKLQPGMTVLDLGCGPGNAALDIAEIVGESGRVVGVDESPAFLKQLGEQADARRLHNIERILGDAQTLDSACAHLAGSVDIVYARWVLCFVPKPADVIAGVKRLLKPGGKLLINDYFNYESMTLAPKDPAFTKVIHAVGTSWRSRGGDPDLVGRLPAMFKDAGLTLEHLDVRQRLARPGSMMWHWPATFWRSFVPRLVEFGHITPQDEQAFNAAWAAASKNPDCFMLLPPVFEVIAVNG